MRDGRRRPRFALSPASLWIDAMARHPRLEFYGALFHLMARGNQKERIFLDDDDRTDLLWRIRNAKRDFGLEVYAGAFMSNHLHLLARRHHESVGRFMLRVLSGYAGRFNRKHGRVGHVFQGRYKALVCQDETYLLQLVRYIHLNPLRAGLTSTLHHPWTSYDAYFGDPQATWLDVMPVLRMFGEDLTRARAAFRAFHESEEALREDGSKFLPVGNWILGDEQFARRAEVRAARRLCRERPGRVSLEPILEKTVEATGRLVTPLEVRGPSMLRVASAARREFVHRAIAEHGYPVEELAGFLRRSPEALRVLLHRSRRRPH